MWHPTWAKPKAREQARRHWQENSELQAQAFTTQSGQSHQPQSPGRDRAWPKETLPPHCSDWQTQEGRVPCSRPPGKPGQSWTGIQPAHTIKEQPASGQAQQLTPELKATQLEGDEAIANLDEVH